MIRTISKNDKGKYGYLKIKEIISLYNRYVYF